MVEVVPMVKLGSAVQRLSEEIMLASSKRKLRLVTYSVLSFDLLGCHSVVMLSFALHRLHSFTRSIYRGVG